VGETGSNFFGIFYGQSKRREPVPGEDFEI
jgi:hypothetical protein